MTRDQLTRAVIQATRLVIAETGHPAIENEDIVLELHPFTYGDLIESGVLESIEGTSLMATYYMHQCSWHFMRHPVRPSTSRVRERVQVRAVYEVEAWVRVE